MNTGAMSFWSPTTTVMYKFTFSEVESSTTLIVNLY